MDRKEYQRQWVAKKRMSTDVDKVSTEHKELSTKDVKVSTDVVPVRKQLDSRWKHLADYIKEGNNLEKMQRIAGSLALRHLDGEVWFGGLTMKDIGDTIGTLPPLY
jgi:hypothetical protein